MWQVSRPVDVVRFRNLSQLMWHIVYLDQLMWSDWVFLAS
jgi:hypothetical protein